MTPKQQIEQFAKINNYKPVQTLYEEAILKARAKITQGVFKSNTPAYWNFVIKYCKDTINNEAKSDAKKRADAHNAYAKKPYVPDPKMSIRAHNRLLTALYYKDLSRSICIESKTAQELKLNPASIPLLHAAHCAYIVSMNAADFVNLTFANNGGSLKKHISKYFKKVPPGPYMVIDKHGKILAYEGTSIAFRLANGKKLVVAIYIKDGNTISKGPEKYAVWKLKNFPKKLLGDDGFEVESTQIHHIQPFAEMGKEGSEQ